MHDLCFPALTPAIFLERSNRFVARCRLPDREVDAHVPATGRLRELLVPGVVVWLTPVAGARRRCHWDLTLVRHGAELVSVDTRLPSRLARVALETGRLPGGPRGVVRSEVRLGESRIDFSVVSDDGLITYVEVKAVTLVLGRTAVFPDAPTLRGSRHLEELGRAVALGHAGMALFLVLRSDADRLRPNDATDPLFAATLRRVASNGVDVRALTSSVHTTGMTLLRTISIDL